MKNTIQQTLYQSRDEKLTTTLVFEKLEGDKFWFNMVTADGGTENHPYGLTTRERLTELRDSLTKLLKTT